MNAAKIVCSRCKGKGYTSHVVVYAGAPGTCFRCAGAGEVYKDPFHRAFGVGKTFFGVTIDRFYNEGNPNNGTFKFLATSLPDCLGERLDFRGKRIVERVVAVQITEDQARRFWSRFGELTTLGGVRVADFQGIEK